MTSDLLIDGALFLYRAIIAFSCRAIIKGSFTTGLCEISSRATLCARKFVAIRPPAISIVAGTHAIATIDLRVDFVRLPERRLPFLLLFLLLRLVLRRLDLERLFDRRRDLLRGI